MKKQLLVVLIVGLAIGVKAQNINTIAGKGTGGFSGDGGQADSAQLSYPSCLAIDDTGNVYIADLGNNRIRKVNTTTGIITTVAGNGTGGYAGDGAAATAAQINQPSGVIFDKKGNMYIGDWGNNVVRKVNNGIITTYAGNDTAGFKGDGGKAVKAELHWPAGLAFDSKSNLYIADYSNNRVRIVDTTGIIKTYVGNGSNFNYGDGALHNNVGMLHPLYVYIDNADNVYVTVNNYVRVINAKTGFINAYAGELSYAGYNGDGKLADSSKMNAPAQMAMDFMGNVYICDELNYRVRMVNTSNTMSTYAGDGTSGFAGDKGPATAAELNEPAGVGIDAKGNLYIADLQNNRVRVIAGLPTSTVQIISGNSAIVYPVPATNELNIKLAKEAKGDILVSVLDITGREMFSQLTINHSPFTISVSSLPGGVYFARIITENNTEVVRFIKQ